MSVMSDQNGPDAGKDPNKKDNENGGNSKSGERDLNAERASRYSSSTERAAIQRGDYSSAGREGKLTPGQGYHTLSGWERIQALAKSIFGGVQGASSVVSGNPIAMGLGLRGLKKAADSFTSAVTGLQFTDENDKPMGAPNLVGDQKTSTKDNKGYDPLAATTNALGRTATAAAAPAVAKPTSTFDYFTSNPFAKQGFESTVLGGGPKSNKSLLGL